MGRVKALLGVAARTGDKENEKKYRQELHDLNVIAAAKRVVAQLPDVSPEKREQVRALLGGA
jgi:DNA-directed RNA polymerase subunit F